MATFKAKYTCIACLPMKGEVMDGVVTIISAVSDLEVSIRFVS
jgi:DNA-directed RNA polymerase subunit E'/Rpb7